MGTNIRSKLILWAPDYSVEQVGLTPTLIEHELDLFEDVDVALTYSIAEIQDISSKNTPFSKTIVIPGTGNNSKIFNQVYKITNENTFPINYPVKAILYEDDLEIFAGFLYLQKIVIDDNIGTVKYEVNLTSTLKTLYIDMGDKLLYGNDSSSDDLDFSNYNHVLDAPNILSTWNKGSTKLAGYTYKYPNTQWNNGNLGQGYVYPVIDYGLANIDTYAPNIVNSYIDGYKPALFHKEIFDKILEKHGYTYTSSFFNSEFWKRLIFPSVKPILLTAAAAAVRNATCKNTYIDWNTLSYIVWHNNSSYPNPYKEYDITKMYQSFGAGGLITAGYQYVIPKTGRYTFTFTIPQESIKFKMVKGSSTGTFTTVVIAEPYSIGKLYGKLMKYKAGVLTSMITSSSYAITDTLNTTWVLGPTNQTMSNAVTIKALGSIYYTITIDCVAGETYYPALRFESPHKTLGGLNNYVNTLGQATPVEVWPTIDIDKGPALGTGIEFKVEAVAGVAIQENDNVDCNQVIDLNIKQVDYITSIIKTFNLYVETDKTKANNLLIEPRNFLQTDGSDTGYYSSGAVQDWSTKLDISKDFVVTEASDLIDKNITFTWTQDNDVYNTSYPTWNDGKIYGEKIIKSRTITDEKIEIKPIFAPTPMDDYMENTSDKLLVPIIYQTINGVTQSATFKPRILWWKGYTYPTYPGNNYGLYISSRTGTSDYFVSNSTRCYYGYGGHLDSPDGNDTLDLNWQAPNMWPYIPGGVDGRNIYYRFYGRMMQEYTDPNSRLITAYFYLTAKEMNKLSFKDSILVDGIYYRLNKIIDYRPNSVTKVELLKIIRQDNIIKDLNNVIKTPKLVGIEQLEIEKRVVVKNPIYIDPIKINLNVIGYLDDGVVIDSNQTWINGVLFDIEGNIIEPFDLIKGGIDEVQDMYPNMTWNIIKGGVNETIPYNSTTKINLLSKT